MHTRGYTYTMEIVRVLGCAMDEIAFAIPIHHPILIDSCHQNPLTREFVRCDQNPHVRVYSENRTGDGGQH